MKKNYIKPSAKCFEFEAEELLQSISMGDPTSYADEGKGMDSKSRSNYEHEDLGWDY